MNGLLKEQPGSRLFTVFGSPQPPSMVPIREGMYQVNRVGVDIYDPGTYAVVDTGAAELAAWFVDGD